MDSASLLGARERLRRETRDIHARVDAALHLEGMDRPRYVEMLARLFGFHAPLEERASRLPWATIGFDFEARRKVRLLAADLRALGMDPDALPICENLPELDTFPAALGGLYVVEGSTLGGRIIARHAEAIGVRPGEGASFFNVYGPRIGSMWTAFCATLDAVCASPAEADEATRAGVETFLAVESWLVGAPQGGVMPSCQNKNE